LKQAEKFYLAWLNLSEIKNKKPSPNPSWKAGFPESQLSEKPAFWKIRRGARPTFSQPIFQEVLSLSIFSIAGN